MTDLSNVINQNDSLVYDFDDIFFGDGFFFIIVKYDVSFSLLPKMIRKCQ